MNRPAEAYLAAASPREGFEAVAEHLVGKGDAAALRELIARHRQGHGTDPKVHYFEGEAEELSAGYDQAMEAFSRGLDLAPAEDRESYRSRAVAAAFYADKAMHAYHRFGQGSDREPTFRQLATLSADNDELELLSSLLDRYRVDAPGDTALARWDAELCFRRGEYAAALDLLARHKEALLKDESNTAAYWDRRVRCLVRLKRFSEAVPEAEAQAGRGEGAMTLVALAHAAAGNAGRAMAALDRHVAGDEDGSAAQALYEDEDLGPLLRSGLLRAWRERHPPPSSRPATRPAAY